MFLIIQFTYNNVSHIVRSGECRGYTKYVSLFPDNVWYTSYLYHTYESPRTSYYYTNRDRTLLPISRKELSSLTRTKSPPSPLEIRRSLSRYVVISQDFVHSPGIGNLTVGRPKIVWVIPAAAFSREPRDCCKGNKLMFWPKISMFPGRSFDIISGGLSVNVPSLNPTCILDGL